MNEIKEVKFWQGNNGLEINGRNYFVFEICDGWKGKNLETPIMRYFVEVAPEYNPTGKRRIESGSLKGLIKKLAKLDYRISTISK